MTDYSKTPQIEISERALRIDDLSGYADTINQLSNVWATIDDMVGMVEFNIYSKTKNVAQPSYNKLKDIK